MNTARKHQRAEDAPEEHSELELARDGEEREDHGPHEHVVDREALLDQEAGVVLAGRLPAVPEQHDESEAEAQRDPHRRLDRGLADRDDVRACGGRAGGRRRGARRSSRRGAAHAQIGTSKSANFESAPPAVAASAAGREVTAPMTGPFGRVDQPKVSPALAGRDPGPGGRDDEIAKVGYSPSSTASSARIPGGRRPEQGYPCSLAQVAGCQLDPPMWEPPSTKSVLPVK